VAGRHNRPLPTVVRHNRWLKAVAAQKFRLEPAFFPPFSSLINIAGFYILYLFKIYNLNINDS
jgi:hypothetical protein